VFPFEESHFTAYGEHISGYQKRQRLAALGYVKDFSLCVDVGAHVGIFSRHFAKFFERVIAIEPIESLRECLRQNVPDNVEILPVAVTDDVGICSLTVLATHNSGCSFINSDIRVLSPDIQQGHIYQSVTVPSVTIDSLDLPSLGLIKIDVQGADHLVMRGAAKTMKRCKPVVLIEEKPIGGPNGPVQHIADIVEFMHSLGATRRERVGAGDRIYTFD
jgi:FkbM family methyltransferase